MKRLLALFLAGALSLGMLAGCGDNDTPPISKDAEAGTIQTNM